MYARSWQPTSNVASCERIGPSRLRRAQRVARPKSPYEHQAVHCRGACSGDSISDPLRRLSCWARLRPRSGSGKLGKEHAQGYRGNCQWHGRRSGILIYGVQDHATHHEVVGKSGVWDNATFQTWGVQAIEPPVDFTYDEAAWDDNLTVGAFAYNAVRGILTSSNARSANASTKATSGAAVDLRTSSLYMKTSD